MPDIKLIAPNYFRAQQYWEDAEMLKESYAALSDCFSGKSHGLVEHSKSFIEHFCKTILEEFNIEPLTGQPSTTELLIAALKPLGLENTRGADKLDKVLSAFNRLSDAITEMRNEHGPVAHGKDGFLDAISVDHSRAFLHAGDAILGLLLNSLEGKQPNLIVTREPYENFPHLNQRIDSAIALRAKIEEEEDSSTVVISVITGPGDETMDIRLEPSRLLYGVDRKAYVDILARTNPKAAHEKVQSPPIISPEIRKKRMPEKAHGPTTEFVAIYEGPLNKSRQLLNTFLIGERLDPNAVIKRAKLIDSLLATIGNNLTLDWKNLETSVAKLKISSQRIFFRFGFPAQNAGDLAQRLVEWLQNQSGEFEGEGQPNGQ